MLHVLPRWMLGFGRPSPKPTDPAELEIGATNVTTKSKLAFVIAHLGKGGAQRVLANAANEIVERGFEVHVITLNDEPYAFDLDPRIVLHSSRLKPRNDDAVVSKIIAPGGLDPVGSSPTRLNLRQRIAQTYLINYYVKPAIVPVVVVVAHHVRVFLHLARQAKKLRDTIKTVQADAVLSFLTTTNLITVLATRGLRVRTIVSERNDTRLQRHSFRVERMRRLLYRRADLVTANSHGALADLASFVPEDKLAFLPNPVRIVSQDATANFSSPTVITVARLVEQKALDVLLHAWAQVMEELPYWRLAIVGDGPLSQQLRILARDLRVERSVDWLGHVPDPFPLLRAAKFFVLTSRFEGMPNALLEAMGCGLPAVVSDASPGPAELIGPAECAGLLVPVGDASATARAIVRLARDEPLRCRLAAAARERAKEYESSRVIDIWLRLLHCWPEMAANQAALPNATDRLAAWSSG